MNEELAGLMNEEPGTEAPMNTSRNYNGPMGCQVPHKSPNNPSMIISNPMKGGV